MENTRLTIYEYTSVVGNRAQMLSDTNNPVTLTEIEMHNLRRTILIDRGVDPDAPYILANGLEIKEIDRVVLDPIMIAREEFRLGKLPMSVRKPNGSIVDVNELIRRY